MHSKNTNTEAKKNNINVIINIYVNVSIYLARRSLAIESLIDLQLYIHSATLAKWRRVSCCHHISVSAQTHQSAPARHSEQMIYEKLTE